MGVVVNDSTQYVPRTTSNFIDGNSNIDEDLLDLDTQVKVNADNIATNTSDISTYSSEDAGSEPYLIFTHLPYDSKVYIADYAAYATARNVIGIALEDITSGQTGKIQVLGIVKHYDGLIHKL